jgi:hypothetical protein
MIKAFGFNCFEYWLTPSLFSGAASNGVSTFREANDSFYMERSRIAPTDDDDR